MKEISLPGCRHDVLGHALKAIGILRALARCAAPEHRDSEAEGWWDLSSGEFKIRSAKYCDKSSLMAFFADRYQPSPIIAAWNKTSGLTDKLEISISGEREELKIFRHVNEGALDQLGLKGNKKISKSGILKFAIDTGRKAELDGLITATSGVKISAIPKESGKKDGTLPKVRRLLGKHFEAADIQARAFQARLLADGDAGDRGFQEYRDTLDDDLTECLDALTAVYSSSAGDNPLFFKRGRPGDKVNTDLFLSFWEFFLIFKKSPLAQTAASLFGDQFSSDAGVSKGDRTGKGTGFFPDAVKTPNIGTMPVAENFPFCALDFLLAVEGALAMRGATSKLLTANARTHFAFPFVFEGSEVLTDEEGKELGMGLSFWFPLWSRHTNYEELSSFIQDAQAQLPSKDIRFSQEFARAVLSFGVDAGFTGFQEFNYRLRSSNVQWPATGRFLACQGHKVEAWPNTLLAPLDESKFIDQFRFNRDEKRKSTHLLRSHLLDVIGLAVTEPLSTHWMEVLIALSNITARLAISKTLRERVGSVRFPSSLPQAEWEEALKDFDGEREFEIARALASIVGHQRQSDNTYSEVESFLGSLLPLKLGSHGWYLPEPPSPQAVAASGDLCGDLAKVLARRYLDSNQDDQPALQGVRPARLDTILAFLRGDLDDRRIAALTLGLAHIGWHFEKKQNTPLQLSSESTDRSAAPRDFPSPPLAYAALRAQLEVETQYLPESSSRQRPKPFARSIVLASQRNVTATRRAVSEALHRLSVVGLPNPYGKGSREEKPYLAGRDIVDLPPNEIYLDDHTANRLAAAVLVPLHWRERSGVFRSITLPQLD